MQFVVQFLYTKYLPSLGMVCKCVTSIQTWGHSIHPSIIPAWSGASNISVFQWPVHAATNSWHSKILEAGSHHIKQQTLKNGWNNKYVFFEDYTRSGYFWIFWWDLSGWYIGHFRIQDLTKIHLAKMDTIFSDFLMLCLKTPHPIACKENTKKTSIQKLENNMIKAQLLWHDHCEQSTAQVLLQWHLTSNPGSVETKVVYCYVVVDPWLWHSMAWLVSWLLWFFVLCISCLFGRLLVVWLLRCLVVCSLLGYLPAPVLKRQAAKVIQQLPRGRYSEISMSV